MRMLQYFVIVSFILLSCSAPKTEAPEVKVDKSPLHGIWKMTYSSYTTPDTMMVFSGEEMAHQIKVFGDDYFSFSGKFMLGDSVRYSTGYGTYTFENGVLREQILMHRSQDFVGNTAKFRVEVKGDTLIQTSDESTDVAEGIYEVYKRLE